jgi:hypothetical protein
VEINIVSKRVAKFTPEGSEPRYNVDLGSSPCISNSTVFANLHCFFLDLEHSARPFIFHIHFLTMHASLPFVVALVAGAVEAHVGAFTTGMYCQGGPNATVDDQNTNTVVNPLYQLSQQDWWFQHDRGCDLVPPKPGSFLELPANGDFTVELAHNRAQTTLSYNGQYTSEWPDGQQHPEDWTGWTGEGEGCIQDDGAMHVQNQTSATGTAFAISYENDISKVTMENLAVFTVLEQ